MAEEERLRRELLQRAYEHGEAARLHSFHRFVENQLQDECVGPAGRMPCDGGSSAARLDTKAGHCGASLAGC